LVSHDVYKEAIVFKTAVYFREIDTIKVKGKQLPTTIYSVSLIDNYSDEFKNNYMKGLTMFKLGNWHLAYDFFKKADVITGGDRVIQIYLDRIANFIKNPPENWDGAFKLEFK